MSHASCLLLWVVYGLFLSENELDYHRTQFPGVPVISNSSLPNQKTWLSFRIPSEDSAQHLRQCEPLSIMMFKRVNRAHRPQLYQDLLNIGFQVADQCREVGSRRPSFLGILKPSCILVLWRWLWWLNIARLDYRIIQIPSTRISHYKNLRRFHSVWATSKA